MISVEFVTTKSVFWSETVAGTQFFEDESELGVYVEVRKFLFEQFELSVGTRTSRFRFFVEKS